MAGLSQINIPSLKKLYSGKVRDTFAVGDDKLLIVASDRISAFDVILGASDKVPVVLKLLLGHAHAERLSIAAIQEHTGLENRHLLCDPHGRQTHTPVGVCHSEPEFLIG